MKKTVAVLLGILLTLCLIPVRSQGAALQPISFVTVRDIIEPRDGYPVDLHATAAETNKYSIQSIRWEEYSPDRIMTRTMTTGDTCVIGHYYFVYITLKAQGSYMFPETFASTIDGNPGIIWKVAEDGETAEIFYTYGPAKKNIEKVEITMVPPVVGKTPTFGKVDAQGYMSENTGGITNQTNGITWTNQSTGVNLSVSNPFKADTKYTVTYYLTAKENYQFNGTKYYINGERVEFKSSNMGQTQVVLEMKDLVPDDGKTEVSQLDLSVPEPADGEKPSYAKLEGTGYYSDNGAHGTSTRIYNNGIAWYKSASSYFSPGTTETFVGGTSYTVKINLLPGEGYKFGKTITAKINGLPASVETFADGSIEVSALLSAPEKEHTHIAGAWEYNDDLHWQLCGVPGCSEAVTGREAHNDGNLDGFCDACIFEMPTETPDPTDPTDPTQPAGPEPTDPPSATEPQVTEPTPTEVTEPAASEDPTGNAPESNDSETPKTDNGPDGEYTIPPSTIYIAAGTAVVVCVGGGAGYVLYKKKKKEM